MALTFQTHYAYELAKAINDEIQVRTSNLVTGHAAIDFPAYKHHVGMVEGLKRALELMSEVETDIEKGK